MTGRKRKQSVPDKLKQTTLGMNQTGTLDIDKSDKPNKRPLSLKQEQVRYKSVQKHYAQYIQDNGVLLDGEDENEGRFFESLADFLYKRTGYQFSEGILKDAYNCVNENKEKLLLELAIEQTKKQKAEQSSAGNENHISNNKSSDRSSVFNDTSKNMSKLEEKQVVNPLSLIDAGSTFKEERNTFSKSEFQPLFNEKIFYFIGCEGNGLIDSSVVKELQKVIKIHKGEVVEQVHKQKYVYSEVVFIASLSDEIKNLQFFNMEDVKLYNSSMIEDLLKRGVPFDAADVSRYRWLPTADLLDRTTDMKNELGNLNGVGVDEALIDNTPVKVTCTTVETRMVLDSAQGVRPQPASSTNELAEKGRSEQASSDPIETVDGDELDETLTMFGTPEINIVIENEKMEHTNSKPAFNITKPMPNIESYDNTANLTSSGISIPNSSLVRKISSDTVNLNQSHPSTTTTGLASAIDTTSVGEQENMTSNLKTNDKTKLFYLRTCLLAYPDARSETTLLGFSKRAADIVQNSAPINWAKRINEFLRGPLKKTWRKEKRQEAAKEIMRKENISQDIYYDFCRFCEIDP